MKLSVITDEITQQFEHALDVMLEYDVRGAELRGLWGTNVGDLSTEQVVAAKRALADRDIVVSALSSPFYKCDLQDDAASVEGPMHLAKPRGYSEQLELLRRLCGLAHEFDTRLIRVFTFWRNDAINEQLEQQVIDAFQEPIKIAEREGVILAVENEHACYYGTGKDTARLVKKLNSPYVKICWDAGNSFFDGELPFPDGYNAVKDLLCHVHIKDASGATDALPMRWALVGTGDIDYPGQINALRDGGYDGYLSLETHYIPESGDTEEGSRACLDALCRMVKNH